jgi:asparagine synthase (glutamine-hydrolysing)
MSAICGVFNRNNNFSKETLRKMLREISHRGSNKMYVFVDDNLTLAYSPSAHLIEKYNFPIQNEEGSIFCFFDGIIYNSSVLRMFLERKKHRLYTNLDDEIVIHLYEETAENFPKYIEGDFALVIWDSNKKKMIISKSLANHKNIFYTFVDGNFVFASELKSILNFPSVEKSLDSNSIKEFFYLRHIPSPFTLFKTIKRIPPNTLFEIKNKKLSTFSYGKLNLNSNLKINEEEIIKKLSELLEKSIFSRIKNQNFALLLSGGIDSSSLLYFIRKIIGKDKEIETYTFGLEKDILYARIASEFFETNHHEIFYDKKVFKSLPEALWYFEFPLYHAGFFQYFLSRSTKNKSQIFWAQGAEELLFGREDYIILNRLNRLKHLSPLFKIINLNFLNPPILRKIKKAISLALSQNPFEVYKLLREGFTEKERKYIFSTSNFQIRTTDVNKIKFAKDKLKNHAYLSLRLGFLSDTFPIFSQELSNPFLDNVLIQFCFDIPSQLKIKYNQERYLLKKIMLGKLPKAIIFRPRHSWNQQTRSWIDENKETIFYFIDKLCERGILNSKAKNFINKKSFNFPQKIWSLLTLEILLELFVDEIKYQKIWQS